MRRWVIALVMCVFVGVLVTAQSSAPSNPLWHDQKIKNYLPHMTWPEVPATSSARARVSRWATTAAT